MATLITLINMNLTQKEIGLKKSCLKIKYQRISESVYINTTNSKSQYWITSYAERDSIQTGGEYVVTLNL